MEEYNSWASPSWKSVRPQAPINKESPVNAIASSWHTYVTQPEHKKMYHIRLKQVRSLNKVYKYKFTVWVNYR